MAERSVNKAILLGRIGGDAETRHTQNGTPVSRFSLAMNRQWTDSDPVSYTHLSRPRGQQGVQPRLPERAKVTEIANLRLRAVDTGKPGVAGNVNRLTGSLPRCV